jgi:hypothetical protein
MLHDTRKKRRKSSLKSRVVLSAHSSLAAVLWDPKEALLMCWHAERKVAVMNVWKK